MAFRAKAREVGDTRESLVTVLESTSKAMSKTTERLVADHSSERLFGSFGA